MAGAWKPLRVLFAGVLLPTGTILPGIIDIDIDIGIDIDIDNQPLRPFHLTEMKKKLTRRLPSATRAFLSGQPCSFSWASISGRSSRIPCRRSDRGRYFSS